MAQELKNKVVFITGSSIGIGRETAYKFAKEGYKVVITYRTNKSEAQKVVDKCLKLGAVDTLLLQLDIMNNQSIRTAVKQVGDKFGEVSILINNAGIVIWKYFKDQSFEDIENQIRTNLEGLIKMTNECLPFIKDMIINIASSAGLAGYPEITTYCATKWGVRGFTKALARELPKVKVFAVNPGVIATQMNDFQGMPPDKVAEVILNLAKGKYQLKSGADVNIWDYVK